MPGEIGAGREQIPPKMPCNEAEDQVEQSGQDRKPGGLEMEITAPAILVGKDVVIACRERCSRGRNRQGEKRWSSYVAGFAPIETWMRDEDFNSADQQGQETQGGDPVGEADNRRM